MERGRHLFGQSQRGPLGIAGLSQSARPAVLRSVSLTPGPGDRAANQSLRNRLECGGRKRVEILPWARRPWLVRSLRAGFANVTIRGVRGSEGTWGGRSGLKACPMWRCQWTDCCLTRRWSVLRSLVNAGVRRQKRAVCRHSKQSGCSVQHRTWLRCWAISWSCTSTI